MTVAGGVSFGGDGLATTSGLAVGDGVVTAIVAVGGATGDAELRSGVVALGVAVASSPLAQPANKTTTMRTDIGMTMRPASNLTARTSCTTRMELGITQKPLRASSQPVWSGERADGGIRTLDLVFTKHLLY